MPSVEMEQAVARALTQMARALANPPRPIDAELVEIWVAAVESAGLTPAQVAAATTRLLAEREFFPQPVHLIEAAPPRKPPPAFWVADGQGEVAWCRERGAVENIRESGGPVLPEEWPTVRGWRGQGR